MSSFRLCTSPFAPYKYNVPRHYFPMLRCMKFDVN